MARKASFTDVEGFQAIDQQLIAQQMVPISVEPKPGEWDPGTKSNLQKMNAAGVPQWLIQTLFYPVDGDSAHRPEVVGISVTAKTKPVIQAGVPANFTGFGAWTYVSREKGSRRILGVGRSFMATGLRQNGSE